MTMVWVFFVAGLVLLALRAEALVLGASRLASSLGVPPLVVGLTVVGYGTSTPEAAVSVQAALAGQADISIGNVVGSNIPLTAITPIVLAVRARRQHRPVA
jgi:cation:H+ antiporter